MPASADILAKVGQMLGRHPDGMQEVAVWSDAGEPMVVRVSSLVDHKPFPTLFWLVDPELNYQIDQLEASGLIRDFQDQIDADPKLQQQMRRDHQRHIALRHSYIDDALSQQIQQLGFAKVLEQRGIGGIADPCRVRCLHTYYAAHLVEPNTIGELVNAHWQSKSAK